jgi:hypothetical protein
MDARTYNASMACGGREHADSSQRGTKSCRSLSYSLTPLNCNLSKELLRYHIDKWEKDNL